MIQFFIRWLINTVALVIVVDLVPGIHADNSETVILAALFLGFFNAVLKPLLILLTLPLYIYSLGLITLFINGLLLSLVAKIVPGFHVQDFGSAFWGALLLSVFSFILNSFFRFEGGSGQRRVDVRFTRQGHARPKQNNNVIDVEGRVKDEK